MSAATRRTVIQTAVGIAAALPAIVHVTGVSEALPGVAVSLGVAAGVTRVMAIPAVEAFLDRFGLGLIQDGHANK
ncbi:MULTISPECIES: hypothetical protein [unclassified Streptomyces]|uniref:hypothetical protein n=1 Tax=unclassified Streptomyces TaxID=2593676 RepID=UPI003D939F73